MMGFAHWAGKANANVQKPVQENSRRQYFWARGLPM